MDGNFVRIATVDDEFCPCIQCPPPWAETHSAYLREGLQRAGSVCGLVKNYDNRIACLIQAPHNVATVTQLLTERYYLIDAAIIRKILCSLHSFVIFTDFPYASRPTKLFN